MAQLLQYSDIDQEIQNRMSGQAPDVDIRLEALNGFLDELNSEYDIISFKRKADISVIPDGRGYKASTLITDNDVKKVADIRFDSSDSTGDQFVYREENQFSRRSDIGYRLNEYTIYYRDGELYLAFCTTEDSSTSVDLDMVYYSSFKALDASYDFKEKVIDDSDYQLPLPLRFRELVVLGCLKRLWPISIGDDAQSKLNYVYRDYNSELKKLGLDGTGVKPKAPQKKVKLYGI